MKIVNIHRKKTPNQGDLASAPLKYFNLPFDPVYFDILDCFNPSNRIRQLLDKAEYLVIGGGGLLDNPKFHGSLDFLFKKFPEKSIIWGVGSNFVGDFILKNDMSSILKVGVRDVNTSRQWVPCASCLSKDLIKFKAYRNLYYKGGIGILENNSGQDIIKVSDFGIPNIRRLGNKKFPWLKSSSSFQVVIL